MGDEAVKRADWDDYFMSIAQVVATRSTCQRKYVGAVLVRNRTILSTGYNGSIKGLLARPNNTDKVPSIIGSAILQASALCPASESPP